MRIELRDISKKKVDIHNGIDQDSAMRLLIPEGKGELFAISSNEMDVNHIFSNGGICVDAATRGLLALDHVILNHGQMTRTTSELAPHLLTTTPHQREDVSALGRFNVHRCPTRRVFSGTGLELVTKPATIRYLYNSATVATTNFRERRAKL
ncbi:uncharacterized protein TNCV_1220141 [Trichonephila clavipes]|nr:uncharacterized protein TNCV_1220141 [Trichonephila clavipes]